MDTTHDAQASSPATAPAAAVSAPKGNQNARKHGRYFSMLKPADRATCRHAARLLRSYGLKDPFVPGGLSIEDLLDDPNTNVDLLFLLLQTTIGLVHIEDRLSRR